MTPSKQVAEALNQANAVRLALAEHKREIRPLPYREGLLRCAELLENLPPTAEAMTLGQLLSSVRHVRSRTVERLLWTFGLQSGIANWRLRTLDQGRREYLANALREYVGKQAA